MKNLQNLLSINPSSLQLAFRIDLFKHLLVDAHNERSRLEYKDHFIFPHCIQRETNL